MGIHGRSARTPMKKVGETVKSFLFHIPACIAALCTLFMLCVIPLYFDDAFFNINRCKVELVRAVMPIFCAAMAVILGIYGIGKKYRYQSPYAPDGAMTLFLLACAASCACAGFTENVLEGTQGRSLGLWLMLCCGGAYYVIGAGKQKGCLSTTLVLICAGLCAVLGILNGAGIDPLGFYEGIKKGQEETFLSTIGHFDFFGTYLVMIFGLATGVYVFGKKAIARIAAAICAIVLALGMAVSRTDSALLGMNLVCLAIAAQSGGDYMKMARAASLWGVCFAVLPAARAIAAVSVYQPQFTGLPLMLCETYAAHMFTALFLILAAVFMLLHKKGCHAPSKRVLMRTAFVLTVLAAAILIAAIVWFTIVDTAADLGSAASFLRFDDMWGSVRGFVYKRSIRAFSDFSWKEKLVGRGLGTTLTTLTPYFDNQSAIDLAGGVFNDSHCQPLQILLTCGIAGMLAFAAFYICMFAAVLKNMKDDAILNGVFAMLVGYIAIMMFNVLQPILVMVYFSICGLGISRIRYLAQREGVHHES